MVARESTYVYVYYLCVADCKNGHNFLLPVSFTMRLYSTSHQEVESIPLPLKSSWPCERMKW